MIIGIEWLVDASGCRPEALRDVTLLQSVFASLVDDLDLRVLDDPLWHKFPSPGGITGLLLLSESHLACHTYPEHGLASFNLYCCRARPAWPWEQRLREKLGALYVDVRSFQRSIPDMLDGKPEDLSREFANAL